MVSPVMVNKFASLFDCTPTGISRSDIHVYPTENYLSMLVGPELFFIFFLSVAWSFGV